ncbi:MAG: hypothetical protein IPM54_39935 [Polyangiaceae bacterium]|nr:hypothetical protein [Polyangiaceae bacterium]
MSGTNGKSNGQSAGESTKDAPPPIIADLAASCVRYVKQSVGFTLDFEPETLPVLDHYVELARAAANERKETALLAAQTIGAYLGKSRVESTAASGASKTTLDRFASSSNPSISRFAPSSSLHARSSCLPSPRLPM